MKYKGVIFDFNGTLLWDTSLHNIAWDIFLQKHHFQLTDEEKNEKIHGKTNKDIFAGIFKRKVEGEELQAYILEKEYLYQNLVIQQDLQLADGVTDLFDTLKTHQIPFTIATSSGIENFNFYFERYGLNRWFKQELAVYDNGSMKSKPHPDFFLQASKNLNLNPAETIVFEDSFAGIKAAENAGSGKIIIINSMENDYRDSPHECITTFNGINWQQLL